MREVGGLSIIFFDFYVPVLASRPNNVRPRYSFLRNSLLCDVLCVYTYLQQRGLGGPLGFGGIVYIQAVQGSGQTGRNLVAPLLLFPGAWTFRLKLEL